MSAGPRLPLARARRYAEQFVASIEAACERVVVAGSIRRGEATVGDIEILATPEVVVEHDLFGEERGRRDLLREATDRLLKAERVRHRASGRSERAWGERYRRCWFRTDGGAEAPIDLYWADRTAWGLMLALRTGPVGLSNALVTPVGTLTHRGRAGLLPAGYRVRDGLQRVRREALPNGLVREEWDAVDVTEEESFLDLVGYRVPPERRR